MDIAEYFDNTPTGAIETIEGTVNGFLAVHACRSCGSLVTKGDRDKHASAHELVSALLHQLTAASHHHFA